MAPKHVAGKVDRKASAWALSMSLTTALSGSRERYRATKALDLNGSHDTPLVNPLNRLSAAARS
jgi:hypothetical protein